MLAIVAVLIVVWYLGAIWLNSQRVIDFYEADDDLKGKWTMSDLDPRHAVDEPAGAAGAAIKW